MNQNLPMLDWNDLQSTIISCRNCPRLVEYRENVPKRASFINDEYWRKPIPGFGDKEAKLLIVGLAPAAHGGNRTGRIFTGDESGRFLFNALYQTGFANQPISESIDDGLKLNGCYMTAAVKCAPPKNLPTKDEFNQCSCYYHNEFFLLKKVRCVLALGKLSFDAHRAFVKAQGHSIRNMRFHHGARYEMEGMPTLYASYHPSQQNTFTKVLTQPMMVNLLQQIQSEIGLQFFFKTL